jgi:hypothetical protein
MKRNIQFGTLIFLAIFLVTGNGVAPAQAPGADATVLLQRAKVAMGCNTITPTTTVTAQGTLKASSIAASMPIRMQTLGNDHLRSELDTPKEHKVTVVNSGRGQVQHADGRLTPLAENNTSHQRPMHIPCLTNLALPPAAVRPNYLRAETVGTDTFDVIEVLLVGRPSLKRAADLMRNVVWISRSTGLLVKLQYVNAAENDSNDTQTVEIDYADYRSVGGLAVPFHQTTRAGTLVLDLQFDSAQLNTAAADFNLR